MERRYNQIILVRYSEIGLKGQNRGVFVGQLTRNIRSALKSVISDAKIRLKHDCLVIDAKNQADLVLKTVTDIFGVANAALAISAAPTMEQIVVAALKFKNKYAAADSFRVRTSRSDKKFPQSSVETNSIVGKAIADRFGLQVNLNNPQLTLYINIQSNEAFLYTEKLHGPGGLPLDSSGRGLVLLSGGIDSAVAAWKMMRRGLFCEFLHFHSLPKNSRLNKIPPVKIVKQLFRRQGVRTRLHLAPYYPFQFEIMEKNTRYELVIFRRFMIRVAEKMAAAKKLDVLVTGDSLGQVASQTLSNLISANNATEMIVARPLIGDNKQDIIRLARKIGTYELAIEDYKDCCSVIARRPATKSTIEKIKPVEDQLKLENALEQTLREVLTLEI